MVEVVYGVRNVVKNDVDEIRHEQIDEVNIERRSQFLPQGKSAQYGGIGDEPTNDAEHVERSIKVPMWTGPCGWCRDIERADVGWETASMLGAQISQVDGVSVHVVKKHFSLDSSQRVRNLEMKSQKFRKTA